MRIDINTSVPAKMVVLALPLMLLFASVVAASAPDKWYRVLVLHSYRHSLPVNTDWYHGIVRGFTSAPDVRVEIDMEFPDLSRLHEVEYVGKLLDLYRHKYHDLQPHLIIATYTSALQFLLGYGKDVFPGIPIVFCDADSQFVAAQQLPPNVTGITINVDIKGTLELISQVHPDAQRVAAIVGSDDIDKNYGRKAKRAARLFEGRFAFSWLEGLPLDELVKAVKNLPGHTVILYVIQLEDRAGKPYVPRNILQALSAAANAPIYGLWDTLLDHGIIGGRLITIEDDGFLAARMGLRILRGEAPAAIPVVDRRQNRAIFNGRELARWYIGEDRLPADSRILYRQLSIWAEHGTAIMTAGLVMGVQGVLIVVLWLNRARLQQTQTALREESDQRRQAEVIMFKQRDRLTRFSKERTLGVMATGIAHEVNQPLIAIQNYAQATRRRLQRDGDQTAKLNELLKKIEQQAERAGAIIQYIRTLITTEDAELHPVSLAAILDPVIQLTVPEIERHGCRLDYRPGTNLPVVLADELQIKLVLVNLLRNAVQAMEAMEDKAEQVVSIEIDQINGREVQISVLDRGPGIPPDKVTDIFEPFYSGKAAGMGVGLAICRSIVEAHGGRIGYTPNPSGGAIFQFTLRLAAA